MNCQTTNEPPPSALKNCPFCGRQASLRRHRHGVAALERQQVSFVQCTNCDARTQAHWNKATAVKLWNARS